jgi:cytochrome c nitrite reductase small subunit
VPRRLSLRRLAWGAIVVLLGVAIGVGGYTFVYAEGASYLSTDPKQCVNCHIMRPQYADWQHASHHTAATCVDCHLPASGVEKYVAKARNGWNHSKAFTLQDFPEPIRITQPNAAILQANCLRCHGDLIHDLVPEGTSERDSIQCVHCHDAVGHGPRAGLGGRDRGTEIETRPETPR